MSLSERHVKSKIGECETCDNKDIEIKAYYANMYQCSECWAKDSAHQTPEAQQARVDALRISQQIIKEAQAIDNGIQVRTDMFNASTTAILTVCAAIDADDTITNKPYAKAEFFKNRFEQLKAKIFGINEQLVEAGNEQKAIQVYLNNMANTLRAEEREKLQIADINYKPNPVKQPTVRTIKTVGSTQKKATKADIKKAAQELGIAEFTLASFVLQSGGNLELAVNKIKASIAAAKNLG